MEKWMKDSKLNYINDVMHSNSLCESLTDDEHIALAQLCEMRHKLHCGNAYSSESGRSLRDALTDYSIVIGELSLDIDISEIETSLDLDFDFEEAREELDEEADDYDDEKDLLYDRMASDSSYRHSNQVATINNKIEDFLRKIDNIHGTNYCPSGYARAKC